MRRRAITAPFSVGGPEGATGTVVVVAKVDSVTATLSEGAMVVVVVAGAVVVAAISCSNSFSRLFCARAVWMPVPHS